MPQARPVLIAPSKNLVMLYSLYLCGYEGVKFEIMRSLHNSLSVMQENGSPAKSEPTKPKSTAQAMDAGISPPYTPLRIMYEYQPPGLAPE